MEPDQVGIDIEPGAVGFMRFISLQSKEFSLF